MPDNNHQNGTTGAAIFVRLWETDDGKLPLPLARHIVKLGFPKADKDRMHELAVKNQQGQISALELEELDNYVQAGEILALLQSKARSTLKSRKGISSRHG